MKTHTNVLLGIATVISLSASTSVFADSIHDVLENTRGSEAVNTITTVRKIVQNPQSIGDYVNNYRVANGSIDITAFAGVNEVTTDGWQEALGNSLKL